MKQFLLRGQQLVTIAFLEGQLKRLPNLIEGEDALLQVPSVLQDQSLKHVLVVTTAGFIRRGTLKPFFETLTNQGIAYTIYSEVIPDPDIACVEKGYKLYYQNGCDTIVAIGGGSAMDCAKIIGARVANPDKTVEDMTGNIKIRKNLPPFFAVPTTAGSGSEVTAGAVITEPAGSRKYPIFDFVLMPTYAVLDPKLLLDLPPFMTAASGMDALTHAVEAYTNKFHHKAAADYAKKAVSLIMANLEKAVANGQNLYARHQMLKGSYYAGIAFNVALVGYVHAISHGIGGRYHLQHGQINASLLPLVLEAYGKAAHKSLADLADLVGLSGQTETDKAQAFIQKIRDLRSAINLPAGIPDIQEADIADLAAGAEKEGNPIYPTPVTWQQADFEIILRKVKAEH